MGMIPQGHYLAKVVSAKVKGSAKAGTPCFHAILQITEDGPHKGEKIEWEGWITDSAGARSIESMKHCGARFQIDPQDGLPDLEDLEGVTLNEIDLHVLHESYTPEATTENPSPRESVQARGAFIGPKGRSSRTKDLDADQRKMIAKRFGGLAKSTLEKMANGAAGGPAGAAPVGGSGTAFDSKAMDAADAAQRAADAAGGKKKGDSVKGKSY